jgi:hypothetical protein
MARRNRISDETLRVLGRAFLGVLAREVLSALDGLAKIRRDIKEGFISPLSILFKVQDLRNYPFRHICLTSPALVGPIPRRDYSRECVGAVAFVRPGAQMRNNWIGVSGFFRRSGVR